MDDFLTICNKLHQVFESIKEQNDKQRNWDLFFLGLAKYISSKSKDPSTKVGAVIASPTNRIVSCGWNGLPQKVPDRPEYLNNRDIKYKKIIHGEINAILFSKGETENCTLYTYPFLTCSPCSSIVIQSGITRVVAPVCTNERWQVDFALARENYKDAGVICEEIQYE